MEKDWSFRVEPEGRLLEEIVLENGLTIFFHDFSRPIAGDRYQVRLVVSIPVAMGEGCVEDGAEFREAYQVFAAAHGNMLKFVQKKTRNFIAQQDVSSVLEQLKEEFLQANRFYLVKEGFAAKFITKKYQEWQDEQRLQACLGAEVYPESAEWSGGTRFVKGRPFGEHRTQRVP